MTSTGEPVLSDQVRAMEEGAGLCVREGARSLRVFGADRTAYLHRMLTQEVASLAPGQATYACLLTVKGRILGDLLLWVHEDEIFLEAEAHALPPVRSTLEKYVIADDVGFEDVSGSRSRFALTGAAAPDALDAVGLEVPHSGRFLRIEGGGASVLRFDRRGLPCFEFAATPDVAAAMREMLLTDGHVAPCAPEAWDAVCVHRGIPVFGRELGEDVLFNEAGLEEAVSWSKGCFPGQEPVFKARHVGEAPRRLVRMVLDTGRRLPPRTALLHDGRAVGYVTSWASGLEGRRPRALGYVRRAHGEAGTELEVEGGGVARVEG